MSNTSITDGWDEAAGQRWIEAWLDEDRNAALDAKVCDLKDAIDALRNPPLNTLRLFAGQMLLQVRRIVEAGGGDWWEWYAANFSEPRSFAERLLRIASAENPAVAYVYELKRKAAYNRAWRWDSSFPGFIERLSKPERRQRARRRKVLTELELSLSTPPEAQP
jgi:hypothetical protein